jgi:phage gp36-like protein
MAEYNSVGELGQYGINPKALLGFTVDQQRAAIRAASNEIDVMIGKVVGVPLAEPYPEAVKVHGARMAVFNLFNTRGFNRDGDDKIIEDNYERAVRFFTSVAKGLVVLGPGITPPVDNPADDNEGAFVYSDEPRGYPTDGNI